MHSWDSVLLSYDRNEYYILTDPTIFRSQEKNANNFCFENNERYKSISFKTKNYLCQPISLIPNYQLALNYKIYFIQRHMKNIVLN